MEVCKRIATRAFAIPSGGEPDGKTTFNVLFYAVSKDGKYAGGSIYPGGKMAVHDGDSARIVACDPFFDKCNRSWTLIDEEARGHVVGLTRCSGARSIAAIRRALIRRCQRYRR